MIRAAILIDGGYYLKRLPVVRPDINAGSPEDATNSINQLVWNHLRKLNRLTHNKNPNALLYRTFFYDATPYLNKAHLPVSGRSIDFSKHSEAVYRQKIHKLLRNQRNMAVRLGDVARATDQPWMLKAASQSFLLRGKKAWNDLTDDDFVPNLRQKGVDMRIGCDIATLTLKKQVNTIILVAGDADFVPAAKMARREGVQFILDPLWRSVNPDLFEHIDALRSGFSNPSRTDREASDSEEVEIS